MASANVLKFNDGSLLNLEVKQGQRVQFRTTRLNGADDPVDLSAYSGKMSIYDQTTQSILGVTPAFVAVDLANGQYGFDLTYVDTQNLPWDHDLVYEMWLYVVGGDSFNPFNGALIVEQSYTPIP